LRIEDLISKLRAIAPEADLTADSEKFALAIFSLL
jgi:hypothetical protein